MKIKNTELATLVKDALDKKFNDNADYIKILDVIDRSRSNELSECTVEYVIAVIDDFICQKEADDGPGLVYQGWDAEAKH